MNTLDLFFAGALAGVLVTVLVVAGARLAAKPVRRSRPFGGRAVYTRLDLDAAYEAGRLRGRADQLSKGGRAA